MQLSFQAALHTLIDIRSTSSMLQTVSVKYFIFYDENTCVQAGVGVGVYFMFMTVQKFTLKVCKI
jgi:hypothetical protein